MSSPMKLTSSASFSPSIRISLRLKIHQAQAKNFCRVLDIRVAQVVKANMGHVLVAQELPEIIGYPVGAGGRTVCFGYDKVIVIIRLPR